MASDTVLSDEQLIAAFDLRHIRRDLDRLRDVERAVVAALAARGEVDVEALVDRLMLTECEHLGSMRTAGDADEQQQFECPRCIADAIRSALATVEARHAKLAEAQRVPDDARLDTIEQNLADVCSCEPESGYEQCNFCKVLNALTALRRRLAEAEKDRERLRRLDRDQLDLMDYGWAILCNVSGGDWKLQSEDWQGAVERYRTKYFAMLDAARAIEPVCDHSLWKYDAESDRMICQKCGVDRCGVPIVLPARPIEPGETKGET